VQLDLMTLSQRDWTLEASDDLRNWSLIATDSSRRHSITFFDVDVPPHSMRFYRVRAAP